MCKLRFIVCLGTTLSAAAAFAQVASPNAKSDSQPAQGGPAVAYVYVASTPTSNSPNEIVGYSASSKGVLSRIPGSPFQDNVYAMAVNGKYLMAADRAVPDIDAFLIGSNGALTFTTSTNYAQFNNQNNPCGSAGQLFFDHTGATLYVQEYDGSEACANDVDASFAVDKASGTLNYLGLANTGAFPGDYFAAYFIGNNIYAYSADQSGCMYFQVDGFQRESSGLLSFIGNFRFNQPIPPPGVSIYYPDIAVADPTNHVAIVEQPANPPGCATGPLQLAVYTADTSGNLRTKSTYKDMPATLIKSPYDMKMSPSGKLLAVGGQEGLQIFHFNGASPIKHYTGLLTNAPINQMFWDNRNHLYAVSYNASKLFVFTITPTTHQKAAGSPHAITRPQNIIVQPLSGR